MKIAVVGAGIFGCTISLRLSQDHDVHLFEASDDIMGAASRTNQFRLHRGYHYPRSPDTVSDLLKSINFFNVEYEEAIIDSFEHYYCIAKEKSLVSPAQYLNFCDSFKLEYDIIENFEFVNESKIGLTLKVKESLLDYQKVYDICKDRLRLSDVLLKKNTLFKKEQTEDYDLIINCTYADINSVLQKKRKNYQFEVCEKILVKMPLDVVNKSIVVMDGPFMCVDPYGKTGNSLLGNVVHAIHSSNTGHFPNIPENIKKLLNRGIIKKPEITNFDKFISTGKEYIPSLEHCKHLGSMFTVRAVLPNMDDTDGRPTLVSRQERNIINVFSGKIDTCVRATNDIINMIEK